MRCRIAVFAFVIVGLTAGSAVNGQGQARGPESSRVIQRNWPDDGALQPSLARPMWEGKDAVGLQYKDAAAVKSGSNVVPVSLLRISGEALKEMRKSDKALLAGDVRGSAEHLEKMLALAPDVAVGPNVLGARYVAMGQYDRAMAEFQRAVALQPNYRVAVDNMAVAMCTQHKYAEAEPMARWALQIQPDAASSKYLLGSILVTEGKATDEASTLLESVKDEYPRARLFLANSLIVRGEVEQAVEQLRRYLDSPLATDHGVVKEWLGRLEKQMGEQRAAVGR